MNEHMKSYPSFNLARSLNTSPSSIRDCSAVRGWIIGRRGILVSESMQMNTRTDEGERYASIDLCLNSS